MGRRRAYASKKRHTARKRSRRPARGQFYKLTWKQAQRLGYTKGQWAHAKYHSEVYARKRRAAKRKYGSLKAARAAQYNTYRPRSAEVEERLRAWREARKNPSSAPPPSSPPPPPYTPRGFAPPPSQARRKWTWAELPPEVRSRVEKLLRLSKSPNIHEANLARARANEILGRYGLRVREGA